MYVSRNYVELLFVPWFVQKNGWLPESALFTRAFATFWFCGIFCRKRRNWGEKRKIRTQINVSLSASLFSRFLLMIFASFYIFRLFESDRVIPVIPRFGTMQKGYNSKENSWLVGKYRQLTAWAKKCSSDLLQNTKCRAIISPQLNTELCSA